VKLWARARGPRAVQLALLVVAAVVVGVAAWGGFDTPGKPVLAAAQTTAPPSGGVEHSMVVAGLTRTFRTFAPANGHDLPLLVVLHGRGQSSRTAITQTGFLGLVQQGHAALVFPDGIGRSWNAEGGCCGIAGARRTPDLQFVTAVVAASVHDLPVDPSRIYLVGYSNGGKLAYGEACAYPGLFAGVATYGSVPLTPCVHGTAMPFLLGAGALDPILPYRGATRAHPPLPPVPTAVGWLRTQDGCSGTPKSVTVGPAVVEHWTRCRPGSEVTFVLYRHDGHTWPGTGVVGTPAAAATLMWSFLDGHRLAGPLA
jgi:polyhydroxybutyrate depolymerase